MQYETVTPASVHFAVVPALPKSQSSGWATTTRTRSIPSISDTSRMVAKADAGAPPTRATLGACLRIATHPDLGRLAELLGDWRGEGEGQWASGEPFRYLEWVTFGHNGKPFVSYAQRTTAADDGSPAARRNRLLASAPGAAPWRSR